MTENRNPGGSGNQPNRRQDQSGSERDRQMPANPQEPGQRQAPGNRQEQENRQDRGKGPRQGDQPEADESGEVRRDNSR